MIADPRMRPCGVCDGPLQMGRAHVWEGKLSATYGILVCYQCREANWNGWALHFETRITRKLLAEGKPLPARNAKGLLPVE